MLYTHLLLREGELFLKGKNQSCFEAKLIENLKKILGSDALKVQKLRGRIILPYFADYSKIKRVFGFVSYSPAVKVKKDLEQIKSQALQLLQEAEESVISSTISKTSLKPKTFKIQAKRSDKTFPITSLELNRLIGRHIEENSDFKFNPQEEKNILYVEINYGAAYLFKEIIPCFGGIPTGIEGSVALLVEDPASQLAGLLMMKRGCRLKLYSYKNPEFSLLRKFDSALQLQKIRELSEISEEVIVTGETFNDTKNKNNCAEDLTGRKSLFLQPLIAYSNAEIKQELKKFNAEF